MADIQYQKGELLFSGDITTTHSEIEDYPVGVATIQYKFNQKTLIVDFNGVQYICTSYHVDEQHIMYGETGIDFVEYPFSFNSNGSSKTGYSLQLVTKNRGTYNIKIYEAIADFSDIRFKKGELLLNETFETRKEHEEDGYSGAQKFVPIFHAEDIVIIDFNGTEYTCSIKTMSMGQAYGGISSQGLDFSDYPFGLAFGEYEGQYTLEFVTENSGTYTVKIYTAIEDSSTESNPVITYLMTSPSNTNWNVLSSMLGDGDWSKLKAYVETTPHNMNRMVLESLLSGESGNSNVVGSAIVGTAVAG